MDDIRPLSQTHDNAIRWSADEHRHFERGREWYISLAVIAAATSLTAIVFNDVFFGILIVVGAIAISLVASKPPRHLSFEINDKGVMTGDTFHSYKEILAFWVSHDEEEPLLLIDTTKFMSPNLIIPLEGVSSEKVRAKIKPHAKEVEMHEPLFHKVFEFFGF